MALDAIELFSGGSRIGNETPSNSTEGYSGLFHAIFPGVGYFTFDDPGKYQEPDYYPVFNGNNCFSTTILTNEIPLKSASSLTTSYYVSRSMNKIMVDPDILLNCSQTLGNSATTLNSVNNNLVSCGNSAPSYGDNHFDSKIRSIVGEMSPTGTALSGRFSFLNGQLTNKARQFLNADGASSAAMGSQFNNLSWMVPLGGSFLPTYTLPFISILSWVYQKGVDLFFHYFSSNSTEQNNKIPIPPMKPSGFGFIASPIAVGSITYVNWYGNTELAYKNRNEWYSQLQGLHSGLDFGCRVGTPITNPINRPGKVIAVDNLPKPNSYGAGPHNIIIDYGDYIVVYGHTSSTKLKVGDEVNPGMVIAESGIDNNGYPHLHMEVIKKDESWLKLPPEKQATTRPGSIRTNPVPFLSPEVLSQIENKASNSDFHTLPDGKWGTPSDQPDITPSKSKTNYAVP